MSKMTQNTNKNIDKNIETATLEERVQFLEERSELLEEDNRKLQQTVNNLMRIMKPSGDRLIKDLTGFNI